MNDSLRRGVRSGAQLLWALLLTKVVAFPAVQALTEALGDEATADLTNTLGVVVVTLVMLGFTWVANAMEERYGAVWGVITSLISKDPVGARW